MSAIWKFSIQPVTALLLPKGAKVLTVQSQHGVPTMWVMLDPLAEKVSRVFETIGTGHDIDDQKRAYIGTFQDGPFVWHVFEILPKSDPCASATA